ncbi:MAG: hypothetical protein IKC35_03615 [Clostridia bacterium]|nr:hypothetical protein [Clostridia bacterium]
MEKQQKSGLVARLMASIYAFIYAFSFGYIITEGFDDVQGLMFVIFILPIILYAISIVMAILAKKNKLFVTLFLVSWGIAFVLPGLINIGYALYFLGILFYGLPFAIVGIVRGYKYAKTLAEKPAKKEVVVEASAEEEVAEDEAVAEEVENVLD